MGTPSTRTASNKALQRRPRRAVLMVSRYAVRGPAERGRYVPVIMNLELLTNATDDPAFVELLKHLIGQLVGEEFPEQIFVMKLDNWFDHKWLNFSGIGRVRFDDFRLEIDTALDEFSQDQVTFPPFTPNRVIGEYYFLRNERGDFLPSLKAPFVHERKLAPSAENLHKRVTDFTTSALFLWVSSNTKLNRRGSVMVYEVKGPDVHTWYMGLSKDDDWKIAQTKGISRDQAMSLIRRDVLQGRT